MLRENSKNRHTHIILQFSALDFLFQKIKECEFTNKIKYVALFSILIYNAMIAIFENILENCAVPLIVEQGLPALASLIKQ